MTLTPDTMEAKTTRSLPYPKAVAFIVVNEFCERFSFYGMRTILALYIRDKMGFSADTATVIYHSFIFICYFVPILGAMIADGFLGRYRTILYLSIIYAAGSLLISISAIPQSPLPIMATTMVSLVLIALGTGGIKPCVSAFGGDQFKLPEQEKQLVSFFSIFYFSINAGSFISTFITPVLRADVHCFGEDSCFSLAFGVPGILMIISVVIFVAGKRLYIIIKSKGNIIANVGAIIWRGMIKAFKSNEKRSHWLDRADDKYDKSMIEDVKGLLKIMVPLVPVPVFWALFDQQGSRWTFQADKMAHEIGGWELKADQMQVVNPLLILLLIPLFQVLIYPFMTKFKLIRDGKPLDKMVWGGMLAALAFILSGIVELQILPTYGTPVTKGLAQVRIYNGYNCELKMNSDTIEPLSAWIKTDIEVNGEGIFPYKITGTGGANCDVKYDGTLQIKENTANSFFVSRSGIKPFQDDIDKSTSGSVKVRFLSNTVKNVTIQMTDKKDRVTVDITSTDMASYSILKGKYSVVIDGTVKISSMYFLEGAVYTINVEQDANGAVNVNPVKITPENSVHILWLLPQYIILTMGEVMFSVTGLEFCFTQAPLSMKSVVQAIWLMTVAMGNVIVIVVVQGNILDAQWKEFFLFAGLMFGVMLVFMLLAFRYKYVDVNDTSTDSPKSTRSGKREEQAMQKIAEN